MNLNKKGFAVSTMLYGLIFTTISIFNLILFVVSSNFTSNNEFVNDIRVDLNNYSDNINESIFSDLLEMLGSPSTLVAIDQNGELYTGAEGQTIREYRYSGPNSEVTNNYISFNNEEEPWRIIGIFPVTNGLEDIGYRMKIIRQTSVGSNIWDSSSFAWSGGTAQQYLANSYTISSPYSEYIEEVDYYLGNVTYRSVAKNYYTQERGSVVCDSSITSSSNDNSCNVWSANSPGYWTGKVGLMYPSDYAYAASSTYWTTEGASYYSSTYNYDWLYLGSDEWTVSPSAGYDFSAVVVYSSGSVSSNSVHNNTNALRPSLYLKSNIRLSGSGTSGDPFVITT